MNSQNRRTMKKLWPLLCIVQLSLAEIAHKFPECVQADFNSFLQTMVDTKYREAFSDYYISLMEQEKIALKNNHSHSVEQRKKEFIDLGACSLEVRNEFIYRELRPWMNEVNSERAKIVQTFLYRCGAYEKYLQNVHKKGQPIMTKMQNYLLEAKNKVISVAYKLDPRRLFITH